MKERNSKGSFNPQLSMNGETQFYICGTVQKIYEDNKNKCDYATFCIMRNGANAYDRFEVVIPHALNIVLEVGDEVEIDGFMRTRPRTIDGMSKIPFIMLEAFQVALKQNKEGV